MSSKKRFKLTLRQRENLLGYVFILPLIIGFVLFVLTPAVQSIRFSLNKLEFSPSGFTLIYTGLENYKFALLVNTEFVRILATTTGRLLNNAFWILAFSFFAASLLNQEFRGRLLARAIFFLPVVVCSGIVLKLDQTDYLAGVMQDTVAHGGTLGETFLSGQALADFMIKMKMPEQFMANVTAAVDAIPQIINASGVQILIFLAGLQSISPSLYEAADVEGATKWECFWMITFPLLSPLIITNVVYTIIDFFVSPTNQVIAFIRNNTFYGSGFGPSCAMSWIYFGTIAVILAIVYGTISRLAFYHE
jgi:ABC-type sugar transport system permease subunit